MSMNENIVLALFGFFSKTSLLSLIVVFCAKWLPYFLVFAAAFYALPRRDGIVRSLLLIFLPAIVAWLCADVIKSLFPAMRPFAALNFTPLVMGEDPLTSFPSAHATFFAALGTTLFLQEKKIGKWFLTGAFLVGFARIAVGIHFPLDILAGFVLGGVIAVSAHYLWLRFSGKSLSQE